MGNASFEQAEFGAGIYRGRRAPEGAVYDALNALVDDEGQLFLRGKSAFKGPSTETGVAHDLLADLFVAAGRRTMFGSAFGGLWVFRDDDATLQLLGGSPREYGRAAASAGLAFFPAGTADVFPVRVYGGSLKGSGYNTGTVSVATGSQTVTGVGTAWLANADPGMIFGAGLGSGVVKSVDSDTQITLFSPWTAAPVSGVGYGMSVTLALNPVPVATYGATSGTGVFVASVGTSGRLAIAFKQRVFLSDVYEPLRFTEGSYLELPSDALITGLDSFQDSVIVFTTRGVWALSNLDFDAVDDAGNVQWQQQQISKDVLLWEDSGVAAWAGALVVPAVDDVYLFAPSGEARPVSEGIRPLYRSYVKAGYRPGLATVHRGHYVLPVLNGATVVDVLVCRLDRPFGEAGIRPWTRWSGHAAGPVFAQRVGEASRSPKLLGARGDRVTDLTGCMDPLSSLQDADGTTPTFRVDTSDFDTGAGIRPNTTEKVRVVYETTGGTPSVGVSWERGRGGFFAGVLKRGGGASDGTDYSAWRIGKAAERIRFRFECASQVTSLVLRRLEVTVRGGAQS